MCSVFHVETLGRLMYGKEESLLGGVDKRLALSIPGNYVLGVWRLAKCLNGKKSVTNTTWGDEVLLLGFSQEGGILTEYFRFQDS